MSGAANCDILNEFIQYMLWTVKLFKTIILSKDKKQNKIDKTKFSKTKSKTQQLKNNCRLKINEHTKPANLLSFITQQTKPSICFEQDSRRIYFAVSVIPKFMKVLYFKLNLFVAYIFVISILFYLSYVIKIEFHLYSWYMFWQLTVL